ncbi:hypothetical protein HOY80DRAFT_741361 [Tuber brumale]|nr:hypothetical protein HOY80DRAFT_741361 [Tuber brumale]
MLPGLPSIRETAIPVVFAILAWALALPRAAFLWVAKKQLGQPEESDRLAVCKNMWALVLGSGGKYWDKQGVMKLLELVVVLLRWFFDPPSTVFAHASATPACPNTSPLPLVPAWRKKSSEKWGWTGIGYFSHLHSTIYLALCSVSAELAGKGNSDNLPHSYWTVPVLGYGRK